MSGPRVALVGARRRRQGLGPFVARDLARAGARVPAFVTSSAATRDAARRELADRCGFEPRGYLDVDEMLAEESLDAVAILSPAETHAAYLEAALAAGLHVLCEKPLVWGCPDLGAEASRLVDAFERRGLLLWENCQWPYTLPTYERLFPGALDHPPRRFSMRMQPASAGVQGFGDSMPHVLSLLQALVPGNEPTLVDLQFAAAEPEGGGLRIRFAYATDRWTTRADVRLEPTDVTPRAAEYALDGRRARRRVDAEGYRLSFARDDGRQIALDDPMKLLVTDFTRALRSARRGRGALPGRSREIVRRMRLLGQLVDGFGRWDRGEAGEAGA